MSMEQLKADLKDSLATVKNLDPATATAADLVHLMRDTVFPTFEAIVEEMDEIDGCVNDILDGSEDILTAETGQMFAAIIAGGGVLVAELEKRAAGDARLIKAIKEWRELAAQGSQVVAEITLDGEPDDEIEEDDEDEDAETTEGAKP